MHEHLRARHVAGERRREEQAHVGDIVGLRHTAQRHRLADRVDARLVAVEEMRLLGHDQPDHHRVTRTFGASSTASVRVVFSKPALAAP